MTWLQLEKPLLFFFFFFFFFFFSCFHVSCVHASYASDIQALLSLKQSFLYPPKLYSWNISSNPSPCLDWIGVSCLNNSSTVINLSLPFTFSGGNISPAIADLPFLQHIDLSGNSLNGSIPPEITRLNHLLTLDLSHNLLTGNIPNNWTNLTQLSLINLRHNHLNGSIPSTLSKELRILRLENNSLSGELPPQITALSKLRYLAVEYNNLTGLIPMDIGHLASLHSLYSAYNQLNGSIPDSIGNLSHLLHFEVECNQLSGSIPASLGNLPINTLNLSCNNFSGPIPTNLSNYSSSSFANNPYLCGRPLPKCTSVEAPPFPGYPDPWPLPSGRSTWPNHWPMNAKIIGGIVGGVLGALALCILCVVLLRGSDRRTEHAQVQNWFSPELQNERRKGKLQMFGCDFNYSYEDIVWNAGFFDTAHVLGNGRFATVYRSDLPDGTRLAVKVFKFANVSVNFEKEIEMLASIRHQNLLSVRGVYSNPVEKAILYDYLPQGTLHDLLHNRTDQSSALPDWATRQRIALGVAKALTHLHRGSTPRILHKDVKSTNILLENNTLNPRLSDVGLVQLISTKPQEGAILFVETAGYTAPEIVATKKYSEKSDVYSYGVVLLELITGEKAVSNNGEQAVNLTEWVMALHKAKRGRDLIDAVAWKTCPFPEYLDKALNLAVLCVDPNPNIRPSMAEVADILEGLMSNPSPLRSPDTMPDKCLLP